MSKAFKVAVMQTDVFGAVAHHAQCLEKGCGFVGKRWDGKRGAEKALHDAKAHGAKHAESERLANLTEEK
jgi:hypothetical protein